MQASDVTDIIGNIINTNIQYRLGTTEKSQLATTGIHGGVGKADGVHSTPLHVPLSSVKIHWVKASPDRSIYESSKVAL